MTATVSGGVAPGYEPVRETFARLWEDIEVGASLCIMAHGEPVVDLWGGHCDREQSVPWQADTLVNVYSTTKGAAALAVAILEGQGRIAYGEPLSEYWPEFGAAGKQAITVGQALSHQGGVAGVNQQLSVRDLYDWPRMTNLIAAQEPLWPPGTASGYHAVTWGYLVGELVRRVTGQSLVTFFAEQVADPLDIDFFIGLPEPEWSRTAPLIGPNHARPGSTPSPEPAPKPKGKKSSKGNSTALYNLALANPAISPFRDACSAEWRHAEIAASNGHASARGVAGMYGAIVSTPGRLLSPDALARACTLAIEGVDLVLDAPVRRTPAGFMLNEGGAYGPNRSSFGHAGAGGSMGFADPVANIGFGYVMNQMQPDRATLPRAGQLIDAFYSCLATQQNAAS